MVVQIETSEAAATHDGSAAVTTRQRAEPAAPPADTAITRDQLRAAQRVIESEIQKAIARDRPVSPPGPR